MNDNELTPRVKGPRKPLSPWGFLRVPGAPHLDASDWVYRESQRKSDGTLFAGVLDPLRATPGTEDPRDRHQSAAPFGSKGKPDTPALTRAPPAKGFSILSPAAGANAPGETK